MHCILYSGLFGLTAAKSLALCKFTIFYNLQIMGICWNIWNIFHLFVHIYQQFGDSLKLNISIFCLNQPAVMYCTAVYCPVSPAVRRTDELLTGCHCVSTSLLQGRTRRPGPPVRLISSYLFIIDNTNSTGRRRLPPAGQPRLYSTVFIVVHKTQSKFS